MFALVFFYQANASFWPKIPKIWISWVMLLTRLQLIHSKIQTQRIRSFTFEKKSQFKGKFKKLETFFSKLRKNSQPSLGSFQFFVRSHSGNGCLIVQDSS